MNVINVEIKARCADPENVKNILSRLRARFVGMDHQIDTYFKVDKGRLKLREGNIENNIIYYERLDISSPKKSDCIIIKTESGSQLKEIFTKALGVLVVVDKEREIFNIDNIKIHIDKIKGMGDFIEIEVRDETERYSEYELYKQCSEWMNKCKIDIKDLIKQSYSDMFIEIKGQKEINLRGD